MINIYWKISRKLSLARGLICIKLWVAPDTCDFFLNVGFSNLIKQFILKKTFYEQRLQIVFLIHLNIKNA